VYQISDDQVATHAELVIHVKPFIEWMTGTGLGSRRQSWLVQWVTSHSPVYSSSRIVFVLQEASLHPYGTSSLLYPTPLCPGPLYPTG
jgi:hypothetical protein